MMKNKTLKGSAYMCGAAYIDKEYAKIKCHEVVNEVCLDIYVCVNWSTKIKALSRPPPHQGIFLKLI
jgi:hypothetical protein